MATKKDPLDHIINTWHTKAATLLSQRADDATIIAELIKEGIDPVYAVQILENVKSDRDDRRLFKKELSMGVVLIFAGGLINYFSYRLAVNLHAFYFYVLWGIIVLGIIIVYRAWVLFKK